MGPTFRAGQLLSHTQWEKCIQVGLTTWTAYSLHVPLNSQTQNPFKMDLFDFFFSFIRKK